MALTAEEVKNIAKERAHRITRGLVGCKCIDPSLAEVLESLIERAKAEAGSHISQPYGEPIEMHDYYKRREKDLEAAENALKSLDLCES